MTPPFVDSSALMLEDPPAYEHDCQHCIFLGQDSRVNGEPLCNIVDLYIHKGPQTISLLRRYSSEPSAYSSTGMGLLSPISCRYHTIVERATVAGILSKSERARLLNGSSL